MHSSSRDIMFHPDDDDQDGFDPHGDVGPATRGVLRQGLLVLALGALLLNALETVHRTHRRRAEGRTGRLPERLQTWEGEGGRPDDPPPAGSPAP
jgi:hypothetical protein